MSSSSETQARGAPDSWRGALARELDRLGRSTRGRFVLAADPSDRLVPATRFLDPGYLRQAIAETVPQLRDGAAGRGDGAEADLRIAVSRFSRRYVAPLSAVALVGLAYGVALDISPARCTVVVRPSGQYGLLLDPRDGEAVRCLRRPTGWPVRGAAVETVEELRELVWRRLYGDHLAPVYTRALEIANVSPRLVWSSAAEWAGIVSDGAEEYLGASAARPFVADREALLGAETLPGVVGPNPLRDKLTWVPVAGDGYPRAVQTRRHCCLTFVLEDRLAELCENCPYLPLEDRVALVRGCHEGPSGAPATPEEQRMLRRAPELPAVQRALRARQRP
jgi:ferric iron reductase protein FhuF